MPAQRGRQFGFRISAIKKGPGGDPVVLGYVTPTIEQVREVLKLLD